MNLNFDIISEHEPVRDWTLGPLSGHRIRVIFFLSLILTFLYAVQFLLWPHRQEPRTLIEVIWSWGSLLWIAPTIFCSFGLVGFLLYRYPKNLDKAEPIDKFVVFRIVSRGINMDTLMSTIVRCRAEMTKNPLFNFVIEVVTDANNVSLPINGVDVIHIKVPGDYQTKNKSLFKARALEYALFHSSAPDNAWLVHLDEETQPTSSGIKGICRMIREEEESKTLRIGQGAILYHREWKKYPILTLADNIRTGVDLGQFYLQQRLGLIFFGFHGSYIVIRNDIEKSVGLDFGPNGSITEDAFLGMVAMEKGYRFRWVEGYLEEQSTQSMGDFIRQRRRWMQGLTKVVLYAPVSPKWKIILGFNILMWNLGPFAALYTFAHFFFGFQHAWWITFLANYSYSSSVLIYMIGLNTNSNEHGIKNWFKKTGWLSTQAILFPYFSLLESVGVLAAVLKPVSGFYVVRK
jgi:beta-1,4-mannosyltransferase